MFSFIARSRLPASQMTQLVRSISTQIKSSTNCASRFRICVNQNARTTTRDLVFKLQKNQNLRPIFGTLANRFYSTHSPSPNEEKKENFMREDIWTIPNIISMSRIAVTPYIGYLVINQEYKLGLALFVVAGFTDLLDGWIARRFKQTSVFGTALDPMADKWMMGIMTVSLMASNLLPVPLGCLILGRDAFLLLGGFYYRYKSLGSEASLANFLDARKAVIQFHPTLISKINTALQLGLVGVSMCAPVFGFVDHLYLQYYWYLVATTTATTWVSYAFSQDAMKVLQTVRKPRL
eukprot:Colp12_sorted_trinity150504_noHs@15503